MPKGYMISAHRSEADPVKRAAYLELAGPAIEANGGKILSKGARVVAKENGLAQQTVIIEFESFEAAVAAYESKDYQKALEALAGGSDRDIRLIEGVWAAAYLKLSDGQYFLPKLVKPIDLVPIIISHCNSLFEDCGFTLVIRKIRDTRRRICAIWYAFIYKIATLISTDVIEV